MYSVSSVTTLPRLDQWLSSEISISVDTAHYAKEFTHLLGELADRFSWRVVNLNEDVSIISAYYEDTDTVISLSFHENGECSLQAKSGDASFSNVCYLDFESDNWLNVQTTVDIVFALIR